LISTFWTAVGLIPTYFKNILLERARAKILLEQKNNFFLLEQAKIFLLEQFGLPQKLKTAIFRRVHHVIHALFTRYSRVIHALLSDIHPLFTRFHAIFTRNFCVKNAQFLREKRVISA
jgi:hypothetical protein